MSCGDEIWRAAANNVLTKAIACLGAGLVAELLDGGSSSELTDDDISLLATAIGVAGQIEARYGPSSARLWFDNPNVFLNSGDEIRPIVMLTSDHPDRYSKLQCALNVHSGESLYDQ